MKSEQLQSSAGNLATRHDSSHLTAALLIHKHKSNDTYKILHSSCGRRSLAGEVQIAFHETLSASSPTAEPQKAKERKKQEIDLNQR